MRAAIRILMSSNKVKNNTLFVQNVGAANSAQVSGTTLAVTIPTGGIPIGHTLIVRSAYDFTNTAPTIADSRSNTYTTIRTSAGTANAMRASIHRCAVTTGLLAGDTITLTYPVSIVNRAVEIDEFSGVLTPHVADGNNGATGVSTTPDTSLTTTNPVDLVIGMVGSTAPVTDGYTQDSTWTGLSRTGTQAGSAPFISVGGAYRLPTSTGTFHYKPVLANSATWVDFVVALKST